MFSLNPAFWNLVSPEIIIVCFGVIFLLMSAVKAPDSFKEAIGWLSLLGFALTLVLTLQVLWGIGTQRVVALSTSAGYASLVIDPFSQIFKAIILIGAMVTVLLSFKSLKVNKALTGEYFTLLTFAVFGMMVMASGADLLTLWVGLETMALSVYVLAAYLRRDEKSVEGAFKYFLLGAVSSGFYLYGASFIYGAVGSVQLDAIRQTLVTRIADGGIEALGFPFVAGLVLLSVALLFKAALVPFHWWTPDAYEGAATPITGFMSVAPKAAAFAMMLRIFIEGLGPASVFWVGLLSTVAIATMIWGNIAAMLQDNVKRMLAYSSIAHAGYVLVAVVAAGSAPMSGGVSAAVFYLFAYLFMNLGAFGLVLYLERDGSAGDKVSDFNGLIHRRPVAAIAMIIFLLSLGGIPPTAGFIGKFLVFKAAVNAGLYGLAVVLAVTSVISLYYYYRIVMSMFLKDAEAKEPVSAGWPLGVALSISVVVVLGLGLYAQPVLDWTAKAMLGGAH